MSIIFLLFLHHLADTIQPSWLIKNKKEHLFAVYEHSFVWAGTVYTGLYLLGIDEMWKFFFLLIGHLVIDYLKYKTTDYRFTYLDQALHYLQIIIVWTM